MKTFPWTNVKRFNFTYAIPGGAWIESGEYFTSDGTKTERNWFSFAEIEKQLGHVWLNAQLKAQGWMTGCWIDCVPVIHREPLKPVAINGKVIA
jgi:hypothetical protein